MNLQLSSTDFLLPEHLDAPMDYDEIGKLHSRMGTGTITVLDDKYCPVAMVLLQECEHVIIIWDLFPPWRDAVPCLHQDRVDIFTSLDNAGVDRTKVSLVCIREELEAWLLADKRALQTVLAGMKHPHPLGTIKNYRNPDTIQKPKTKLTQLFQRELGRRRKYVDSRDAKRIVSAIPDFSKIRRSVSFQRFHDILTGL